MLANNEWLELGDERVQGRSGGEMRKTTDHTCLAVDFALRKGTIANKHRFFWFTCNVPFTRMVETAAWSSQHTSFIFPRRT